MRLSRLRLRHFRQHADTTIDFDGGLTGIIGPNGSGKTTILEGIAWALYGTPAVRGTREGIRSLRAPARARVQVELDFELAGHRYHVSRSLTGAELYLDGASSPIANSVSGVTDLLRRRLGMTQQEFFNTYFTGQKELSVLAAMGPAERAQFLSRVLGYERLRSAQALVRERRNVIKGELSGIQSAMLEADVVARLLRESESRLKDAQERANAALAQLKQAHERSLDVAPRWLAAQQERQALQEVAAEVRVQESNEASLARDAERLDKELAEIVAAREELARLKAELEVHKDLATQLHQMEALFQEEGRRRALIQNRKSLEEELATLRERRARVEGASAKAASAEAERDRTRRELDEAASRAEAARTEWVRDRQEATTRRESLLAHYREIKDQRERLADLGPDSPCPICTRPLAEHFREVVDELDGKLTEVLVNGKYFAARVEQLDEMPTPLRDAEAHEQQLAEQLERQTKALTDLQLQMREHAQLVRDTTDKEKRLESIVRDLEAIPSGYHVTRHAELRQRHEQFAPMAARYARLGALEEREPEVRKGATAVQRDLKKVRARLVDLRKRQSAARFSDADFNTLREQHEQAASELRAGELAALGAEKELDAARTARAAAEQARQELARTQERLRTLTADRRLHDELDRAYTDMRAELNQHLRPEISELASSFLSELTDGRYGELELDDDYNIIVLEDGIPKPVISGGEEDLANLVLRLAISQMIAERAGQSFSLLVLDEVFGSLDDARRHNVVELLRRLHDRFEQVVLITHIESVREGLDRVLTVRYDEETGTSRVEQDEATDGPEHAEDIYETAETAETAEAAAPAGAGGADD
ncbi:MAG TPA: SMC family ATPase [Gemmatimonadaceae bacterium]|nr:SMC family ATPase [Gemmatimonadaceae bacterium]